MRRIQFVVTLPLLMLLGETVCGQPRVEESASHGQTLSRFAGEYVGQWKLLSFTDVPYVELSEYLKERDFGKRDTLRVEALDDSTLAVRMQRGRVELRVAYHKAYARGAAQEEEVHFRVLPGKAGDAFRYRSADGRLQLSFRVTGGAGGYSYLGTSGYDEGDGYLRMPQGELDAQCVVEHEGTFDGHTIRMEGMLRFVFRLAPVASAQGVLERMDARCRGCF